MTISAATLTDTSTVPGARLRRVSDHIRANLEQNLTLARLGAVACMSPYHFARLFHRTTGVPPHRFVLQARIDDSELGDFNTGFNLGAGAAYRSTAMSPAGQLHLGARRGRDRTPSSISGIQGLTFNRFLYDGDIQLRYPFRVGVAPYVFAGVGGVTVRRPASFTTASLTDRSFTKGAGSSGWG
jgi:hypothetical protein